MQRIKARAPLVGMGLSMIGPALLEFGTDEQKSEHLPQIASGAIWWCQGYGEPNSGSDLASLQTRAILMVRYVINGQKGGLLALIKRIGFSARTNRYRRPKT